MIVNDKVHPMLRKMQQCDNAFYQTGSRYFGVATDKSDWDFFTVHSEGIVNTLLEWGFQPIFTSGYSDTGTLMVMRYMDLTFQIDVILVESQLEQNARNNAQCAMYANGIYKPTTEMWNLVLILERAIAHMHNALEGQRRDILEIERKNQNLLARAQKAEDLLSRAQFPDTTGQ